MALPPLFDPIVNAPRPQKLVAGVAGLIIIAAAGYFLLLAPAQEQVTQLRGQLTTLQREVERNRAIVADLAKYRREVVELEARLNALKDRLPGAKEIPTLYPTLTDAAAASGLGACGSSQPTPPPPKPAAAPAKPSVPAVAQAPAPEDKVDVPKYDPRGRRDPFETL